MVVVHRLWRFGNNGSGFVGYLSLTNEDHRVATDDSASGNVRVNQASRRYQSIRADGHPPQECASGRDPSAIFDNDGRRNQVEASFAVVVATGAEIDALRYTDVAANPHRRQVVDPGAFTNPNVAANL